MEAVALSLVAVGLAVLGCAATVLSARVIPLWIRVRGQAHGRFAGLSAAQEAPVSGSKRGVGPGLDVQGLAVPDLTGA
jgi:hypothetical protein